MIKIKTDKDNIKKEYETKIKELNEKLTSIQTKASNINTSLVGFNPNNNIVTTLFPGERAMSVLFMTMGNQDIHNYAMTCKNTDLFVQLEEKLYNDYPDYKNYDTYFQVNTRRIKRFKTIEENNIQSNDIITLFVCD